MTKVTAAILVRDNLILIAKRKAGSSLAGKWEFPGGKIENNETPEQCLKRELKEEFQVEVSIKDFFAESTYQYPQGTIQLLAYWARWESGHFSPTAHDEYQWVRPQDLSNYDFAPADLPFVEKLRSGNFEL